jgi:isochorismate synthase
MSSTATLESDFPPVGSALQLLNDYHVGAPFFFASPRRTLLAQGVFAEVPDNQTTPLPRRVALALEQARASGHSHPVVVGAVPFDVSAPAQLVVARTTRRAGPLSFDPPHQARPLPAYQCDIRMVPEPAEYMHGVDAALTRIREGATSKVVLSRTLELSSRIPIAIEPLLYGLARHNPHGYTFTVDLPRKQIEDSGLVRHIPIAQHRTLIGASPELLVSKSGGHILANPRAGSAARDADPVEDRRRAEALLASAKDRHEHAVVIDAVAEALRPYCRMLHVPAEPSLIHTRTMWHLSTEIRGELADPTTSSLTLAAAMHPTPAVCGHPTAAARELIAEIEPFDRGFFTGMVGWCDAAGDGEWAVTIRCAEVEGHHLRLYAGAGIVAGSTPEQELAETSAKFRTMLNGMGIHQAQETLR